MRSDHAATAPYADPQQGGHHRHNTHTDSTPTPCGPEAQDSIPPDRSNPRGCVKRCPGAWSTRVIDVVLLRHLGLELAGRGGSFEGGGLQLGLKPTALEGHRRRAGVRGRLGSRQRLRKGGSRAGPVRGPRSGQTYTRGILGVERGAEGRVRALAT